MSGTFTATGTEALTETWGNAFSAQPAYFVGHDIALIVLAVCLPILGGCLRWIGFGRGLLLGAAMALSADWFSFLPARSELAPANFGWTAAKAARLGFTASWFPTIGFIVLALGTLLPRGDTVTAQEVAHPTPVTAASVERLSISAISLWRYARRAWVAPPGEGRVSAANGENEPPREW